MRNINGKCGLRILLPVVALLLSACTAFGPNDPYGKIPDERAIAMLKLVRHRLSEMGVVNAQKGISLEFGYYAGCRTGLLEHVFVDGCLGFRAGEEIYEQAGPEKLRQIAEEICSTEACPYRGEFAMTVRYFRESKDSVIAGGLPATINTQVGDISRFRIKGATK